MRNYYDALGLSRQSNTHDIVDTINSLPHEQIAEEGDLQAVMQNDDWRTHYQRVHLQYEAIAATLNSPAMNGAENSHSWDKRVVEFEPAQDTLDR